jgi:hypothetical protein
VSDVVIDWTAVTWWHRVGEQCSMSRRKQAKPRPVKSKSSHFVRTSSALFTFAVLMTRTHAQKSNYWPGVAAHTHIRSTVGRILAPLAPLF